MATRQGKRSVHVKNEEVLNEVVSALTTHGEARFLHLGRFAVVQKKGGQRFDFRKKKMVPFGPYKAVVFRPAEELHDLMNPGNPRRKQKRK